MLVRLGVRRLKLPSGEITNKPLLECAAETGLPLLMSSGMATLEEVQRAVKWIAARWQAAEACRAGTATSRCCIARRPIPRQPIR